MAQWKRAGSITQRSEDQNFALLKMLKNHLLTILLFFSTNQIEEKSSNLHQALENAIEIGNSARVVTSWVQGSFCQDIGFHKFWTQYVVFFHVY